ncbi:MAG: hypothetical protein AB1486_35215, partial [Planctomycetota bacterium]
MSPPSQAQLQPYAKSYWLNPGDYDGQPNSLQWDPALGEFGYDIGGHVDFSRWLETGHPYSQIKDQIVQAFFDPDALAPILATQTPYELPPPEVVLGTTECSEPGAVWYLDPTDHHC